VKASQDVHRHLPSSQFPFNFQLQTNNSALQINTKEVSPPYVARRKFLAMNSIVFML